MSIFKKKKKQLDLKAFISGRVIPIEEVEDEAFASKALGDGVAIEPRTEMVMAPCTGTVSVVMEESRHAVGMLLENGAEILLHVGLDTVDLNGEGFELLVKTGDKVKEGDKMIRFDSKVLASHGCKSVCILAVINSDQFPNAEYITGIEATAKETVILKL